MDWPKNGTLLGSPTRDGQRIGHLLTLGIGTPPAGRTVFPIPRTSEGDYVVDHRPVVSVIVPVYNDLAGVLRCLEGLSGQTYPASHVHVMLVDNGSTPALRVEGGYPFEFEILRCETPGSYAARNAGAKVARGGILAFIDADCAPEPDWLAAGVAALDLGKGRYVVGGEVQVLPPEPRTGVGLYQYLAGFQQEENIRRKHFSVTANLFCYTEQFQRIGPFVESLMSGGDREWGLRARDAGVAVMYVANAAVVTRPRTSMSAAIRQARRIAGGRKHLRDRNWRPAEPELLKRHRPALTTLRWILGQTELSRWERCKVLWAALIIRLAAAMEYLRLSLGARPERQ